MCKSAQIQILYKFTYSEFTYQQMGFLFSSPQQPAPPKSTLQTQILKSDVMKVKLKHVRDKLKNYINLKTKQEESVNAKIKELVPEYQQTGSKKKMMPYLSLKKNIRTAIEQGEMQLKVILDSLSQVQTAEMNKMTIDAVEESNKHVDEIMKEMQAKNWQQVLEDSKQKYQLDWPQDDENLQDDPTFQEMWKQLGGDKLDQSTKRVQKKTHHVEVPHTQQNRNHQTHEAQFA